jgi:hypothetical protein
MKVASYGTVHSRIELHYTPITTPQRKKQRLHLADERVRFRRRVRGGSRRALCSFRCRVDNRWHRCPRSRPQWPANRAAGDGDEFVGLLCQFDPPEHKALARREGQTCPNPKTYFITPGSLTGTQIHSASARREAQISGVYSKIAVVGRVYSVRVPCARSGWLPCDAALGVSTARR